MRDFGLPCGHEALLQLPGALPVRPESSNSSASSTVSCWSSSSPYFNAGLLLYNLKAWRQQGPQLHSALLQFGFKAAHECASGSNTEAAAASSSSASANGSNASGWSQQDVGGVQQLLRYSDQDALNLLCCGKDGCNGWVQLDYCWNVQVRIKLSPVGLLG